MQKLTKRILKKNFLAIISDMMILIFGEASSGKSRYAESRLSELSGSPKIYVATSEVYDAEMMRRVEIHQAMRADKGFLTIERPRDLGAAKIPAGSSVMIESLTAWTANEMFAAEGVKDSGHVVGKILADLSVIRERVNDVVIVADDIFSDGEEYDSLTENYVRTLAELLMKIAALADEVTEIFAGMPITYKP